MAKILLTSQNYSNSAYNSQQSAEKTVKAILILLGEQIYEYKIASDFYDIVYSKYPEDYIEEIYFLLSELETHWLKSRYILKSRDNKIINPLDTYDKKKAEDLYKKSSRIMVLVRKFLKDEFDID